jgi:hypothetical protein
VDWGDVPTWVGAVGTVGALFFAVITLRSEFRSRRADEADKRRAQASLVTAWTERSPAAIDDMRGLPDEGRERRPCVVVSNQSDGVVHEVFWTLWDEETESRMDHGYVRALGPRVTHRVVVPGPLGGEPTVRLIYQDAEGVLWGRASRLLSADELSGEGLLEASADDANDWRTRWPESLVRRLDATDYDGPSNIDGQ